MHLRAADIIQNGNNNVILKRLNIFLYVLGLKLQGRTKTIEMMQRAGAPISNLINRFNNTGAIYQPPYCLNARRVYDMVAVFGVLKYNDLARSIIKSGLSPRNIVHMDPSNTTAMRLVTSYWRLIETLNTHQVNAETKNEAEHMFHQLLLQKNSAYSNTTAKAGNLFAITFRGAPGGAAGGGEDGAHQRNVNTFLVLAGLQLDFCNFDPERVRVMRQENAEAIRVMRANQAAAQALQAIRLGPGGVFFVGQPAQQPAANIPVQNPPARVGRGRAVVQNPVQNQAQVNPPANPPPINNAPVNAPVVNPFNNLQDAQPVEKAGNANQVQENVQAGDLHVDDPGANGGQQ